MCSYTSLYSEGDGDRGNNSDDNGVDITYSKKVKKQKNPKVMVRSDRAREDLERSREKILV